MKPLALTDGELDAVLAACRPLDPGLRDVFLRAVATALQTECGEVGPGTVARVCRELQREYFDPPDLDNAPRWGRIKPKFEVISKRAKRAG